MVAAVGVFRNGRVSERSATDGCHTGCALAAVAGPPSGKAQAEKYRCPLGYLMLVVAAREDRDSNRGETFAPNGFQDRRLRPLGHPPERRLPVRTARVEKKRKMGYEGQAIDRRQVVFHEESPAFADSTLWISRLAARYVSRMDRQLRIEPGEEGSTYSLACDIDLGSAPQVRPSFHRKRGRSCSRCRR